MLSELVDGKMHRAQRYDAMLLSEFKRAFPYIVPSSHMNDDLFSGGAPAPAGRGSRGVGVKSSYRRKLTGSKK